MLEQEGKWQFLHVSIKLWILEERSPPGPPLSPPRVPLFACGPGFSHPSLKVSGRDCMLLGGQGGEILGMEMPETATVMSRVDEVISVCGWLGKG